MKNTHRPDHGNRLSRLRDVPCIRWYWRTKIATRVERKSNSAAQVQRTSAGGQRARVERRGDEFCHANPETSNSTAHRFGTGYLGPRLEQAPKSLEPFHRQSVGDVAYSVLSNVERNGPCIRAAVKTAIACRSGKMGKCMGGITESMITCANRSSNISDVPLIAAKVTKGHRGTKPVLLVTAHKLQVGRREVGAHVPQALEVVTLRGTVRASAVLEIRAMGPETDIV